MINSEKIILEVNELRTIINQMKKTLENTNMKEMATLVNNAIILYTNINKNIGDIIKEVDNLYEEFNYINDKLEAMNNK